MRTNFFPVVIVGCLAFGPLAVPAEGAAETGGLAGPGNTSVDALSPVADLIATATPRRMNFSVAARWVGAVQSVNRVTVPALEAGRVISVQAKDQDPVRKGDRLFTLGGPAIDTRAAALQTSIKVLRQRLAVAKDTLEHRRHALEQKLATQSEVDAARAALLEIQSNLDSTTQSLHALELQTHILAPIDGIFTGRKVSTGQDVAAGTPLADIVDPNNLRIVARVFSSGNVSFEGKPATVELDDATTLSARVVRVLPERTSFGETLVWIGGAAIDRQLKPGQGVQGTILLGVHSNALAVPRNALVYEDDRTPMVFVKEGNEYRQRRVKTGRTSGDWVEIRSGLTGAEQVVTRGAYELHYRDFNKLFKPAD